MQQNSAERSQIIELRITGDRAALGALAELADVENLEARSIELGAGRSIVVVYAGKILRTRNGIQLAEAMGAVEGVEGVQAKWWRPRHEAVARRGR